MFFDTNFVRMTMSPQSTEHVYFGSRENAKAESGRENFEMRSAGINSESLQDGIRANVYITIFFSFSLTATLRSFRTPTFLFSSQYVAQFISPINWPM